MKKVHITIDGIQLQVPENYTILEAAKEANIWIPTLCFLKDINEIGACRMCVVEVKGARSLQAACVYPVAEGLEVYTQSPVVREARKVTLELILSNHDRQCLTCSRNNNCELQKLADDLNIQEIRFDGETQHLTIDDLSPSIVRDPNKCILCRRCISVCQKVQAVSAIGINNRGFNTVVGPVFEKSLAEVPCVNCGQCITACPVGALRTKDATDRIWDAVHNNEKYVIIQTAPAVRAAIGEEFGMPIGTAVTSQMVGSLKKLGFDKVFDTNTGADITIMEEGYELIHRIQDWGKLPMFTSCCPGWIKFCEHEYPELLNNISTCKSPHEMFGALLKSYYAEKEGIDPSRIFIVSVMPCTAKKFEARRQELAAAGYPDVDEVITTRELAGMIKEAGIDFEKMKGIFDQPMGEASGAAVIFGATGGVMEAALRTVTEIINKKPSEKIEYKAVRGVEGIKEAAVDIKGTEVKVAVVHGLGNARILIDRIKSGESEYHFVEVMACEGGCITGGGQPIQPSKVRSWSDLRKDRAKALYKEDRNMSFRKSHENQIVKEIYEDYLGEPGKYKAHELLHTHYKPREKYEE